MFFSILLHNENTKGILSPRQGVEANEISLINTVSTRNS